MDEHYIKNLATDIEVLKDVRDGKAYTPEGERRAIHTVICDLDRLIREMMRLNAAEKALADYKSSLTSP